MDKYEFRLAAIDVQHEKEEYFDLLGGELSKNEAQLLDQLFTALLAEREAYDIVCQGEVIGSIEVQDKENNVIEIGIEILEPYQKRGHAFCALREMMAYLCAHREVAYFEYLVESGNIASVKLAEKLGGILKEEKDLPETALLVYHIYPEKGE